jgi:hypothetical protein
VNEKDLNIFSVWFVVIDWMSGGVDGKSPELDSLMSWRKNWWSVDAWLFASESLEDDVVLGE